MNPVLSELLRGDCLESRHRGAIAIVSDGKTILESGDTRTDIFPRSSLKLCQALAVLEQRIDEKYGLTPRQIALICASHTGDALHVAEVRRMLACADIPESALRCGAHPPGDAEELARLAGSGELPLPVHNNCSGKHAGMLMLARELGADLDDYLDPNHPVQRRIRRAISDLCRRAEIDLKHGVDGCSAPAYRLSIRELATAFSRLATANTGNADRDRAIGVIVRSIAQEPHFASGRSVFDRSLIQATGGGVICKRGAEGVFAIAVLSGIAGVAPCGIAIKIDDGTARGYFQPVLHILRHLRVPIEENWKDAPPGADGMILSHRGQLVGRLRVSEEFRRIVARDLKPGAPATENPIGVR